MSGEMFNFDNSMLKDFTDCEAYAVARHCLGRESLKSGLYGDLGNAGHVAMETHFRGGDAKRVLDDFERKYDEIVPVGETPPEPMMEKENLKVILDRFCEVRPVEKFPFEPIEFEKSVGVEIAPGFKFWMKRDLLAREKASGMQVPVDHKFRFGMLNEWWMKKFRLSSQFSGYIWANQQLVENAGNKVYVNAVSFGKLPDSTRKCKVHKVPFIECRRQHADFQMLTFVRTPEQLEKWRLDCLFFAQAAKVYFQAYGSEQMLPYALRRGQWKGSCMFCNLFEWCKMEFDPGLMEELTIYKPWEPWKEKGKEKGQAPAVSRMWYYQQSGGRVWPCEPGLQPLAREGVVVIAEKMALNELWRLGRDAWMKVWQEYPYVQEAMAQFARGMAEGN